MIAQTQSVFHWPFLVFTTIVALVLFVQLRVTWLLHHVLYVYICYTYFIKSLCSYMSPLQIYKYFQSKAVHFKMLPFISIATTFTLITNKTIAANIVLFSSTVNLLTTTPITVTIILHSTYKN